MRPVVLVALCLAAGCGDRRPVVVEDAGIAAAPEADAPPVDAEPSPSMLGAELDQDGILERVRSARAVRFKPVGSRSIVYQMLLDGDADATFAPRTRQNPDGPRSEVAAYRIARLLGMDNVPPAVTRRVHRDVLHARLHPDFEDAWPEIAAQTLWDDDDMVTGAAVFSVDALRGLGLEERHQIERWTARLRHGAASSGAGAALDADVSRMLLFDYLVGNVDRWRHGPAQGTPDGARLFLRDHRTAFVSPLDRDDHRAIRDRLLRTEKLSRSFVDALRAMTDTSVRTELARDPEAADHPALSPTQLRDVMRRRTAILSYAAALVDQYGEDTVFVFP